MQTSSHCNLCPLASSWRRNKSRKVVLSRSVTFLLAVPALWILFCDAPTFLTWILWVFIKLLSSKFVWPVLHKAVKLWAAACVCDIFMNALSGSLNPAWAIAFRFGDVRRLSFDRLKPAHVLADDQAVTQQAALRGWLLSQKLTDCFPPFGNSYLPSESDTFPASLCCPRLRFRCWPFWTVSAESRFCRSCHVLKLRILD